jgi:MORN repeat protein
MLIPILCLVLALQEPRTESWPDGAKKAEYEVVRDAQGKELLHGPYRSFHENGAKAAAGNYADGLRSGPWETFFEDGKPESKGSYVRGAMSGRWSFWGADGAKDLAASGMYELVVYRSKEDGRHYRGYLVDNLRQGVWTSYWPDKKVQLEGSFTAGKRTGRWLFTHPDGVPSSLLLSGNHADGAWAGGLELPEPPPFDTALFPELEPAASGWPVRRAELRAELDKAVAQRKIAPELTAELVATGVPAIPVVLELLRTLDPESERGRAALGLLEDQALRPLCAGHALSPHGPSGPPDAPAARELVRAWLSLWLLTRTDLDFWSKDVPGPSRPGAALRDVLQDPPILERDKHHVPEPAPAAEGTPAIGPDSVYRLRFGRARESALRAAAPGTADSVTRALAWLARHQAPDGHWSNADFEAECRRRGEESCGQPGNVNYDVGVGALALLALMGDGNASGMGTHSERVVRGLDWLVRTQTAEGLIGTRETHDFLYGHALATTALCEGFGLGAEALRAPAERAVAFLQLARHPEFAWRYDVPATEHGDTSVTGWAVHALLAASHAGLSIDPAAFAGTLAFLDDMSDAQTGRVGYLGRGELSARNHLNEMFPNDLGEPLTGIGLWCRIQLGQRPATTPLLSEHAKLIASKPPHIDKQWGADQYHLYHGTAALWELGGPLWDAWQAELRKAVVLTQAKRADLDGSWDPIGPWGYALGRVGSTALMALTLETPYRYPRVLATK